MGPLLWGFVATCGSIPWVFEATCGSAVCLVPLSAPPQPLCPIPPGFSVEGPSQAKIECDDRGDGSCDVCYWPTEPGDYAVHVLCDGVDIARSPFMAAVRPATRESCPEKVTPSLLFLSFRDLRHKALVPSHPLPGPQTPHRPLWVLSNPLWSFQDLRPPRDPQQTPMGPLKSTSVLPEPQTPNRSLWDLSNPLWSFQDLRPSPDPQ